MPASPQPALALFLRALDGSSRGDTDGQLLERFLSQRDEVAFTALVGRHGSMVLSVCRRILGNVADAEDAFQATFLVLVRKAAALTRRAVLGDFLHGVARRTALKARGALARRRAKEQAMARPAARSQEMRNDWLPLLDEQLARLPEKYRLPILLCDLEGRTRGEAAERLGWPEGTVAGRLARGREMLAKRLTRQGLALSAGSVAAALLPQPAVAGVPAALEEATVKAANLFVLGPAAGVIPEAVVRLTEGVTKAMVLGKLNTVLAALVVLATVAFACGVLGRGQMAGKAETESPPPRRQGAEGDKQVPHNPPQQATKAMNTLRFDLALDKKTYEVGEPIVLTLRLTNSGSLPLQVPVSSEVTGRHDGYSFQVQKDRGETLKDPCHEYIALMHSLGSSEPVQPGNSCTRDLLLNYRVSPLKPGKYTVKGSFQPRGEGQKAQVESADVSFRIVATPAANLEKRVARLAEEVRTGGDAHRLAPLLGFTGHAAAVGPLVDLLSAETDGVQAVAAQALLYLDKDTVKKSLLDSLRMRGPSDRMIHLLVVPLQAKAEEVTPLLVQWLEAKDGATRYAAVSGIALSNGGKAAELLPLLEQRLKDPLARVRQSAAAAIGAYQNAAALKALKAIVHDSDPGVSEQATIAVGWVAAAAKPASAVREEALEVLRDMVRSGGRPAEQATYWLGKVENN